MKQSGNLIVVEGVDGSGKTTLLSDIATYFSKAHNVVRTRQPGGTEFGGEVRSLMDVYRRDLSPRTAFLLFAADRSHHTETCIRPALREGALVLCDRMEASSVAYQGYGQGCDLSFITAVNSQVMSGIAPDLTLYVRVDVATAEARRAQRLQEQELFDSEKRAFFARVVEGFDACLCDQENTVVLDATQPYEVVVQKALESCKRIVYGR